MSKVVKAVAIGALVGLTAGLGAIVLGVSAPFAGAFGIGTTTFAGLSATSAALLAAAAGSAFYAGLGAIANEFLIKKPGDLKASQQRLTASVSAQELGKWIFGETAAATDVVYVEQHGGSNTTDFVTYIIQAASHKIESYGDLYLNDELVTFTGNAADGAWSGALYRQTRLGTESQTSILPISGDGLAWPVTADGLGIAHYQLRWTTATDKVKGGIPTRITQVVKGMPVYDPRLDTTVGGSGLHRANDQTTWEYNDGITDIGANWALVVLSYLLGWKNNGTLVFGVGCDPSEIDYDQAIAAANICEETVDAAARFFVGGIIPTNNNHEAIIAQLEAAVGGSIAYLGGKYYIWAPNDDLSPTFNRIDEEDIVRDAGIEFVPSGPLEELFNTARGRYISPADLYQPIYYPDVVEASAVTEDGRERAMSRDFSFIQTVARAERVARHMVRRSRFSGTWRFSMGPKGLIFKPFDITVLNCQETNNVDVEVRIINMTFNPAGVVQLEVVEEDTSIYDTAAALGTPIVQLDPSAIDPSTAIAVAGFSATEVAINGDLGTTTQSYQLTWTDPGPYVKRTEIQYRPTGTTNWIIVPPTSIDLNTVIVTGLEPGTEYELWIRHVTIFDVAGAWQTFTGTTNSEGVTSFVFYQASAPSGVGEKAGDVWVDTDDDRYYRYNGTIWQEITPDDLEQALVDIAEALGVIEVYIQGTKPTGGSYTTGDIWIDDTTYNPPVTPYAYSMINRYQETVTPGVYDFESEPTDIIGRAHVDALNAQDQASAAQTTADGKIVSFAQASQPTAEGVGDFWVDTDDDNKLYRWSGSTWDEWDTHIARQTADDALLYTAQLQEEILVYVQNSAPSLTGVPINSVWIDDTNAPPYTYSMINRAEDTGTDAVADTWVARPNYNIGTAHVDVLNQQNETQVAQTLADNKIRSTVSNTAPAALESGTDAAVNAAGTRLTSATALFVTNGVTIGDTVNNTTDGSTALVVEVISETVLAHTTLTGGTDNDWDLNDNYNVGAPVVGDFWVDDDDDDKLYRYDGSAWQYYDLSAGRTTADTKNRTYIAATAPTAEANGDIWIDTDDNQYYRWSGTTWDPYNSPTDLENIIAGDLDDIADGVAFFKSTATQNTGGTRAANALDSSNDYIRSLVTTKIAVAGSNPTNGLVIDSAGLRGYDGGTQQFNIPTTSADIEFAGNVVTSGQVVASGSSTSFGLVASIVAEPTSASADGVSAGLDNLANGRAAIRGTTGETNCQGVNGLSTGTTGRGVTGSGSSSSVGVYASHTASGTALQLGSTIITGDANFEDDVIIDLTCRVDGQLHANATTNSTSITTGAFVCDGGAGIANDVFIGGDLDVSLTTTLGGNVTINGNSTLDVDRSVTVASDAFASNSSLIIGAGRSASGTNTLIIDEGAAPTNSAGQIGIYAHNDSGESAFGLVQEQGVDTGTGAFVGINQIRIAVNGVLYNLPIEAV